MPVLEATLDAVFAVAAATALVWRRSSHVSIHLYKRPYRNEGLLSAGAVARATGPDRPQPV